MRLLVRLLIAIISVDIRRCSVAVSRLRTKAVHKVESAVVNAFVGKHVKTSRARPPI